MLMEFGGNWLVVGEEIIPPFWLKVWSYILGKLAWSHQIYSFTWKFSMKSIQNSSGREILRMNSVGETVSLEMLKWAEKWVLIIFSGCPCWKSSSLSHFFVNWLDDDDVSIVSSRYEAERLPLGKRSFEEATWNLPTWFSFLSVGIGM